MIREHGDNRLDRRKVVAELMRERLARSRSARATPGLQIIYVELSEDIGATTSGMAAAALLDWDGSADVDSGESRDVYEWPVGSSDLVSGDKTRAIFSLGHNRWEFLTDAQAASLCDQFKDLSVATSGDIPDIQYILGVDDSGVCFRVPVADCE